MALLVMTLTMSAPLTAASAVVHCPYLQSQLCPHLCRKPFPPFGVAAEDAHFAYLSDRCDGRKLGHTLKAGPKLTDHGRPDPRQLSRSDPRSRRRCGFGPAGLPL